MKKLIKNIRTVFVVENAPCQKPVCGKAMAQSGIIENAYILIDGKRIHSFGRMDELEKVLKNHEIAEEIDATGRFVLPGFVDSHTHIVFAGSREAEFVDKINGLSYEEIARRGGGILNSAEKLRRMDEDELFEAASKRVLEVIMHGTTSLEIKSGYGLSFDSELKILRVIRRLKEHFPIAIKATFLGAHAIPLEYRNNRSGYIDLIVNEMLPAVADQKLADFVDVFCDEGFFTVEETSAILEAAAKYGLKPKIHANELANSGGVQVGIAHHAVSVDHLERIDREEINALLNSDTMPVALPGASFYLQIPYAPVRRMVDAGLPVVLASDFNPGSSPSGNMQFIMSLGCIYGKLLPEEALHAVTLNGAFAMELQNDYGSVCPGKIANLLITKEIPSIAFMPYYYGFNKIDQIMVEGHIFVPENY
ncbi:MAG: imidazolonepropionase [Bacteroidetes bacterium HGW-Bacteroidetes-6]|jgi:imidazolonepropionase|nr:MAG: imidazolonepropionase [Bacteroidetes bacterium HGW-Bacteroidetes-6]